MEEFWGEIPLGKEEKGVAEEKKQGIFGTLKLLAGSIGIHWKFDGKNSSVL